MVKNCGQTVHDEVANKQTMEELKELLKRQVEVNVRNKILYLIQAWAHAFRNEPKYKVVQDTYQIMKVEGHVFPEFKESDAMFAAERAPTGWMLRSATDAGCSRGGDPQAPLPGVWPDLAASALPSTPSPSLASRRRCACVSPATSSLTRKQKERCHPRQSCHRST